MNCISVALTSHSTSPTPRGTPGTTRHFEINFTGGKRCLLPLTGEIKLGSVRLSQHYIPVLVDSVASRLSAAPADVAPHTVGKQIVLASIYSLSSFYIHNFAYGMVWYVSRLVSMWKEYTRKQHIHFLFIFVLFYHYHFFVKETCLQRYNELHVKHQSFYFFLLLYST